MIIDQQTAQALGSVQKVKGLQGHLVVCLSFDFEDLTPLKAVFIEMEQTWVPYVLETCDFQDSNRLLIQLTGITNRTLAYPFRGKTLWISQELFNTLQPVHSPLEAYIGYAVVDHDEGNIGVVQALSEQPYQTLLVVSSSRGEILIPYHQDLVVRVDIDKKILHTVLPKGFLTALGFS